MTDGHGAVVPEQQQSHGLAHDVGATQHHTVLAAGRNAVFPQQFHDTIGGAGPADGVAHHHFAHVFRVEAVHILGGRDGAQHLAFVNMLGQGQLHQNAVHSRIGVHLGDDAQQLLFRGFGGQLAAQIEDAAFLAVLFLTADIDLRGGIFAHQQHSQTGAAGQGDGFCRHLLLDLFGKSLAV